MHGMAEPLAALCPEPLFVDGMFAWLHRPEVNCGGETAVLICPALSRDALDSHRFVRVLADQFAEAGYPALRFDYPGTGDSADLAPGGNPWTLWQDGVRRAADALLRATGARRLILCGLRIGATLAALAADRDDVAGLILLAPVVRGQSYLRQLWVEAGLQAGRTRPMQEGFSLGELEFGPEAVKSIAAADLRAKPLRPELHVLVCAQAASAPLAACEKRWTAEGARLRHAEFNGLEPLLSHNLHGETPPADFRFLLQWTIEALPPSPVFPVSGMPGFEKTLRRRGCTEQPLTFGPQGGLFGMLCQPDGGGEEVVILCGGGRNPHYGVGRSAVRLAESLAQAGIASLRIDFAGLGDSRGPAGRETVMTSLFEDRLPDLLAAIDRLEALGYRRFAVQGLCSGAFHALQAALADTRISKLILVNLPSFEACDDAGGELAMRQSLSWRYYLRRLTYMATWQRILNGRHDLRVILHGQLRQLRRLFRAAGAAGDPAPDSPHSILTRLSERGVEIQFIFGPDEAGYHVVEAHFGPGAAELVKLQGVTLQRVANLDHLMGHPQAQRAATNAIIGGLLPAAA